MGQAKRTTKIELNFNDRTAGGANTGKREYLFLTRDLLNAARAFYVDFFLAHSNKLEEKVTYWSGKDKKFKERKLTSHELLTWAESLTVSTEDHPNPLGGWNFSEKFPGMPVVYRRSVIKDAIGKVRSYLSNYRNWEKTGKKKGKPGLPAPRNHPTLYQGALKLELEKFDRQRSFVRKLANQLKGKIIEHTRYKAYYLGIVTAEVNPHGTSRYCSRCGEKGERFSFESGGQVKCKWGKLFYCPHCGYQNNADFNASVNVHHSFYQEFHWQPKEKAA